MASGKSQSHHSVDGYDQGKPSGEFQRILVRRHRMRRHRKFQRGTYQKEDSPTTPNFKPNFYTQQSDKYAPDNSDIHKMISKRN